MDRRCVDAVFHHPALHPFALSPCVQRAGDGADDTSGDVKRVLSAMAKDEAVADADAMKKAMKGLGTDDDALIDILADRSLAEIERMKVVFKRTNPENGDLAKWVIDDTSGDFREVMLSLRT